MAGRNYWMKEDTPEKMQKIYHDMLMAKSGEERLRMVLVCVLQSER